VKVEVTMCEGLKHLLIAIPKLEKTSDFFREYLTSGSKLFWDKAIIQGTFFIHLSQLIESNLLPTKDMTVISKCLEIHKELLIYLDYTPEDREYQERALELIYDIKKELLKVIEGLIKISNLNFEEEFKNEYPESYSLLQNLK